MDAIEFVQNYQFYLDEIKSVIRPDLFPILEELRNVDPHDLVQPNSWFPNESAAQGFVYNLFLERVEKQNHN